MPFCSIPIPRTLATRGTRRYGRPPDPRASLPRVTGGSAARGAENDAAIGHGRPRQHTATAFIGAAHRGCWAAASWPTPRPFLHAVLALRPRARRPTWKTRVRPARFGPRLPTGRTSYSGGVASGTSVSGGGADPQVIPDPGACAAFMAYGRGAVVTRPRLGIPGSRVAPLPRVRVRALTASSSAVGVISGPVLSVYLLRATAGPGTIATRSMRMTMRLRRRCAPIRQPAAASGLLFRFALSAASREVKAPRPAAN
jgi:hypothetical protein